ncbi:MAG: hypothetical protein ACRD2N_15850 [Vicinamibacterales bacterium]
MRAVTVNATAFASIHSALGDDDAALEWLDRAVEQREPIISTLAAWPIVDHVRAHRRCATLLARMKLPPRGG